MAKGDVQVNLKRLDEVIPPEVRQALLQRAAAHAIGIIRRRTLAGVDVDGRQFVPYSKGYARLKVASGRNRSVNLTLGGGMLAGLVVLSVTPEQALVGFQGSTTPYQFSLLRTKKGTATGRWAEKTVAGVTRRRRITQVLSRQTTGAPISNALKAAANDRGEGGHNPRRHFFGLSVEERRQVIEEAARTLRIRIR